MSFQYRMEKVLDIKEKEKDTASAEYEQSVTTFEQVAEQLYSSLKQKESLESAQHQQLQSGLSISALLEQTRYLEKVEQTIRHYQMLVQQARATMQSKQQFLAEKSTEVKKFHKMRDKQFEHYQENEKKQEYSLMDEVSIQQFMRKRI